MNNTNTLQRNNNSTSNQSRDFGLPQLRSPWNDWDLFSLLPDNMMRDIFSAGNNGLSLMGSNNELERLTSNPVNIKETDKEYILEIATPGFNKNDINVTFDNGYIYIQGNLTDNSETDSGVYITKEYSTKSFSRRIYIGDNVKPDTASANMNNGVLNINIPKLDITKEHEHQIKIK